MALQMAHECVVYVGRQGLPEELGASLSPEQLASIEWRSADEFLKNPPAPDAGPVVLIADNLRIDRRDERRPYGGRLLRPRQHVKAAEDGDRENRGNPSR